MPGGVYRPFVVLTVVGVLAASWAPAAAQQPTEGPVDGNDVEVAAPEASPSHDHDDHAGHEHDGRVLSAEEAMEVTAELVRESLGGTTAGARAALDAQRSADAVLAVLSERYPDSYAGAVSEDYPGVGTTVMFHGGVPDGARTIVDETDLTFSLREVRFSLDELRAAAHAAHQAALDAGFDEVVSGVDTATQRIDVEVATPLVSFMAGPALTELADVTTAIEVPVDVAVSDGPLVVEQSIYGGDRLFGGGNCTTGFSMTSPTDPDGFVTAGHCHPHVTSYRHVWGRTHPVDFRRRHRGGNGDMGFYTTTSTENDDFYYSENTNNRIDVTGRKLNRFMDVGDVVCRFGRSTGSRCTAINRLWVSWTNSDNGITYASLVRTNYCNSSVGDSGGPWYTGGTAWGIHQGKFPGSSYCLFTTIENVEGQLGLAIMR